MLQLIGFTSCVPTGESPAKLFANQPIQGVAGCDLQKLTVHSLTNRADFRPNLLI